jgi:hypothetical protein
MRSAFEVAMQLEALCVSCMTWSTGIKCAACGAARPDGVPRRAADMKGEMMAPTTPPQAPEPEPVRCPQCRSAQITAQHRGFSFGKAATGVVLVGALGLAAGAIGNAKVVVTCIACGHSWRLKR